MQKNKTTTHLRQTVLCETTKWRQKTVQCQERRVLLHQCPLWIPKWTIYSDERWKQEEVCQSHRNPSFSLPNSWHSNCLKGKSSWLRNSCYSCCVLENSICICWKWLSCEHIKQIYQKNPTTGQLTTNFLHFILILFCFCDFGYYIFLFYYIKIISNKN